MKDMFELYNNNLIQLPKPDFKVSIEDVCNPEPKVLFTFMLGSKSPEKKDRAYTYSNGDYEFKSGLNKESKVFLPKNNPLQDFK
jgi:hypothetical protein